MMPYNPADSTSEWREVGAQVNGATAYYARVGTQGNADFLTSEGVDVIDEPAGIYSFAVALAALCAVRALSAGQTGRVRKNC